MTLSLILQGALVVAGLAVEVIKLLLGLGSELIEGRELLSRGCRGAGNRAQCHDASHCWCSNGGT